MNIAAILHYIDAFKSVAPVVLKAVVQVCTFLQGSDLAKQIIPDSVEKFLPEIIAACNLLLKTAGDTDTASALADSLKLLTSTPAPQA